MVCCFVRKRYMRPGSQPLRAKKRRGYARLIRNAPPFVLGIFQVHVPAATLDFGGHRAPLIEQHSGKNGATTRRKRVSHHRKQIDEHGGKYVGEDYVHRRNERKQRKSVALDEMNAIEHPVRVDVRDGIPGCLLVELDRNNSSRPSFAAAMERIPDLPPDRHYKAGERYPLHQA
jgi:hypothetical protein